MDNNVAMSVCSWVPVADKIGIAINGMIPMDGSVKPHYYCLMSITRLLTDIAPSLVNNVITSVTCYLPCGEACPALTWSGVS